MSVKLKFNDLELILSKLFLSKFSFKALFHNILKKLSCAQDNFFKILWNNALNENLDKNSFDKINSKSLNFNFTDKDLKAFDILGLDVTRNWENIRSKFKKLVKKFHPDMNAGNKKFEEKLKVITLAYTQLKRALKK